MGRGVPEPGGGDASAGGVRALTFAGGGGAVPACGAAGQRRKQVRERLQAAEGRYFVWRPNHYETPLARYGAGGGPRPRVTGSVAGRASPLVQREQTRLDTSVSPPASRERNASS